MPTVEQPQGANSTSGVIKPNERQVRISRSAFASILARRLVGGVGVVVVLGFVLYLCFAATVVRIVPTSSGVGLVPLKNVTYPGGIVPTGANLLVDRRDEVKTDWMSRLSQSFVPSDDAALVSVLAGPYGKMTWAQPGIIAVNGKPMKAYFAPGKNGLSPIGEDNQFLKDQYLVKCVKGACKPGEAFIVDKASIFGSPLKHYTSEVK